MRTPIKGTVRCSGFPPRLDRRRKPRHVGGYSTVKAPVAVIAVERFVEPLAATVNGGHPVSHHSDRVRARLPLRMRVLHGHGILRRLDPVPIQPEHCGRVAAVESARAGPRAGRRALCRR
jgi:hypothetical protein